MGGTRASVRIGRFVRAGRRTNLALLWLLIGCVLSGGLAFASGHGVAAVLAAGLHGVLALAVITLSPWKNAIVQRVRRLRHVRVTGLLLFGVVVLCLLSGFVELLFGYVDLLGLSPIQLHVGSAIAIAPLLIWHVLTHRRQRVRRTDLSRRTALRSAAGLAGAAVGVTAFTGAAQLSGGAARRPVGTGSRPVPAAEAPATIWLFDRVPAIDTATHRVQLPKGRISIDELSAAAETVRARLDCTSGWYADVSWSGRRLADLLALSTADLNGAEARGQSLVVRSVTGYVRTFALSEADRLWLVVAAEGEPLRAGNGGPVRLVAPGRRGFWWVKWVGSVEISERPSWLQLPFPVSPLP